MGIFSGFRGLATRSGSADGERSIAGREPAYQMAIYGDPVAHNSRIPRYRTPSPTEHLPDQRRLRSIARHLYRTNPRIESAINRKVEITVGSQVKPKTRYRELQELFLASCDDFDNRGNLDFAGLIADVATNFFVDGDAALRVRSRVNRPAWNHLQVPIQFQSLTCDWMPDDYDGTHRTGARFVNGVALRNDQKVAYAVYTEHPGDAEKFGRTSQVVHLPANEIYHLFRAGTGVPRGVVPITSAISTAEDLADLEAFAAIRRKNSAAMATFLEQPASGLEPGGVSVLGEQDKERSSISKTIRNLFIRPGDTVLMPPGVKANMQQPAGDAVGHDQAVKTATMVICSIVGIPYHEALGDWKEAPERAMRYAGAALKRRVVLDRKKLEKQVLNRLWRDFVNVAMATGMWTPPPGATLHEIYQVEWSWPVVQSAALDRELAVMLAMVAGGIVPPSQMTEDYFGLDHEDVARRWARDAATAQTLGLTQHADKWQALTDVAKRILKEVEEEEAYERDLAEEARLDRSVMKHPVL